jgi:hypothetical protein
MLYILWVIISSFAIGYTIGDLYFKIRKHIKLKRQIKALELEILQALKDLEKSLEEVERKMNDARRESEESVKTIL